MKKVLIFAGTAEGRTLADILRSRNWPVLVCGAAEYGDTEPEEEQADWCQMGRMDASRMEELFRSEDVGTVVDATHPYAVVVSEKIRVACLTTGVDYLRLLQDSEAEDLRSEDECIRVDSVEEAVEFLKDHPGRALLTIGSRELNRFTELQDYRERLMVRVQPSPEVAAACLEMGFEGKNLIMMQGTFSEELNAAVLKQMNAAYLVTKDCGREGGFREKIRAARRAGVKLILIRRPAQEEGYSLEALTEIFCPDALDEIRNVDLISTEPRTITLVGIGMGSEEQLTWEGVQACQKADLIIGARRMLDTLKGFNKPEYVSYKSEEIIKYIRENSQYHRVVIALSGDVGFYSGAKNLLESLEEVKVDVICGISSLVYFCGRLHKTWEDVRVISLHGRSGNLVAALRENARVFSLIGGKDGVNRVCRQLIKYGMDQVQIWVGQDLSYPQEKIWQGTPSELLDIPAEGLNVILLENPAGGTQIAAHGIPDEEFLRDNVPMTREEVREVSVSKMHLRRDSVIYDVGGGTGSISVECARIAARGQVFAVEKKPEAVALIERNCQKFGTPNVMVINGMAPDALRELPSPTHAFIGGSTGGMRPILDEIRMKNPEVRFVVNAVSMESVGELMEYLGDNPPVHEDVIQMQLCASRVRGSEHVLSAMDPVLIAAFDYCSDVMREES